MEHFEYVKNLVGIDHVTLGPDTLYGDHVGLHGAYSAALSLKASKGVGKPGLEYDPVEFVDGLENPTEGSYNIVRWLVKHDYSEKDIAKIMGKNTLRLLKEVWVWFKMMNDEFDFSTRIELMKDLRIEETETF